MTMRDITLGEAIHVKHGLAFKGEFFRSAGEYIVLTPGNFHEAGGFRARPGKDRFYVGDIPQDYILDEGAIIIAMTEQGPGLLGSAAIVPEKNKYLHNQRIGLVSIKDSTLLDCGYTYFLFNTHGVRAQINGSASGTKVRHTAPERIYRVKVSVPSVSAQKKIAEILRAYDALIANNRKRIALLERTTQLLFDEWFVRLRYPGYEHDKIADGIPEGWQRTSIGEAATNFDSKRRPLSVIERENRPGPFPYHGAAGILSHIDGYLFDGRYLLVGEDGTVTTAFGTPMLQFVEGQFWVSNHAHILQGRLVSTEFLFNQLSIYQIGGHITGVAQPKLTQANLNRIPMLLPKQIIRDTYQQYVSPVFDQIFALQRINRRLRQARDLLLPRLMDGRIAV